MKSRKRIIRLILLSWLICIAVVILSFATEPLSIKLGSQFEAVPLEIAEYDLNDLGVVDVNQDDNLDIYTTNHSSQQSLLIGDGQGTFDDVFAEWGLSQDHEFPRLENSDRSPDMRSPGFYFYRQRNLLHLVAHETQPWGTVRGAIKLSAAVRFPNQSLADVAVEKSVLPSGVTVSTVAFSISPGGHLAIKATDTASKKNVIEIPHQVQLDEEFPLTNVFVGLEETHPQARQFELLWRDRHSMAWSDVNADGQLDVFIARGGIHGKMQKFPEQFSDELFINQENAFEDRVLQAKLEKKSCSARQSTWVDFDQDDRLDIFVVCGRNASDGTDRPHQLFHQQPDGTFENVASAVGLNLPRVGEFVWLEANRDSDVDVVATQDRALAVYLNQNEGKTFTPEPLGQLADSKVKQFTVVDFDQDGRLDVYVAGRLKSYLMQQSDEGYVISDPTKLGLPGYSLCANWVDYDNDGLSDLHVIPGGLYRQKADHTFVRSHLLSDEAAIVRERLSRLIGWQRIKQQKARCSFFDYNNDGFRDVLLARLKVSPVDRLLNRLFWKDPSSRWQVRLFKSKGGKQAKAHWLALTLKGKAGNPEAVGASIALETSAGTQLHLVGSSEGSHFSQGHYRVYFGLGAHNAADKVTIRWPDGEAQVLTDVEADQLLTVEQPVPESRA